MRKKILCQTTQVGVEKTLAGLQKVLTEAGALAILVENQDRRPRALKFQLELQGRRVAYELPARVEGVFQALQKQRSWRFQRQCAQTDRDQAERIAWRQLLRWVEAQIALTQHGMAELPEVFLPYAITLGGRTLYAEVKEHRLGGFLPAVGSP